MYDAIIVGARCAGAPAAMLLARKGYRVLLLDRATFPSDTISTHIIWPHGAELMDRWGLLARLAATGCPPIARQPDLRCRPVRAEGRRDRYQRRTGRVLSSAHRARQIAASTPPSRPAPNVREGFTVESLLWDGDRVAGISGQSRTGGVVDERARRRDRRRRCAFAGRQGRPGARVRREAAAHHQLLQLLQRIRRRRSRGVHPRLPGRGLLPDPRRSDAHRRAVAEPHVSGVRARHRGARQEGARIDAERRRPTAARQA